MHANSRRVHWLFIFPIELDANRRVFQKVKKSMKFNFVRLIFETESHQVIEESSALIATTDTKQVELSVERLGKKGKSFFSKSFNLIWLSVRGRESDILNLECSEIFFHSIFPIFSQFPFQSSFQLHYSTELRYHAWLLADSCCFDSFEFQTTSRNEIDNFFCTIQSLTHKSGEKSFFAVIFVWASWFFGENMLLPSTRLKFEANSICIEIPSRRSVDVFCIHSAAGEARCGGLRTARKFANFSHFNLKFMTLVR